MRLIDTHTHLYLEQFDNDRNNVIKTAIQKGIDTFLLPNIDVQSIDPMLELCQAFPTNCFPMMGLHPTSVGADFENQLQIVEQRLAQETYSGVGEIGLDFYWDTSFREQQLEAFRFQLQLAIKHNLPVAIHTREAFSEILEIVESEHQGRLRGVFHCFTGGREEAVRIMKMNMLMGIGGVLTFKKAGLDIIIKDIPLSYLILETDSPFLAPVPYRGKRNESGYLLHVANKLAEVKEISLDTVAEETTANAIKLFKL